MKSSDLITDAEIDSVHGFANFGGQSKRSIVDESVLKVASRLHIGSTATRILADHGLIKKKYRRGYKILTKRGREYLYVAFKTTAPTHKRAQTQEKE